MANASYDTLTIKINADSKQANSSIRSLSNNLNKLNDTAKNIDLDRINEVKGLLLDIAKIDFSNVSKGLQDVVSAFKSFNNAKFMKATQGGTNLTSATSQTSGETFLPDVVKLIEYRGALVKVNQALAEWVGYIPDFSYFSDLIRDMAYDAEFFSQQAQINKEMQDTIGGFWNMQGAYTSAFEYINQTSGTTVETWYEMLSLGDKLQMMYSSIDTSLGQIGGVIGNKALGFFKKTAIQFARILKYRVIRKIIQDIYKALQEATAQIVELDSNFANSFNEIKNSLAYVGNSIMAMLTPLLEMVAPFITLIADSVGNLANQIGELFARLNGADGFAKATKGAKDFASELKKTQSIGIDELNVLSPKDNNFEMVDLIGGGQESGLAKTMTAIGEIISSIIEHLRPALELAVRIIDEILRLIGNIGKILSPIIDGVLSALGVVFDFVNLIFSIITLDFKSIEQIGKRIIQGFLDGISAGINFFIRILNFIAEVIDRMIQAISWLWGDPDFTIGRINEVHIQAFATGGFPEDGMFFANHNELVGTFDNGKTAVANNEQITDGIYQAVLKAMNDSGGNNITIDMDGQKVAKMITKRQNNFGSQIVYGNINYGK